MASNDSAPSVTGTSLIVLGATATAVGGLGVGFRAAGLGYLGQSLAALVLGVAMLLTIGLKIAAAARRSVFDSVRLVPVPVRATATRTATASVPFTYVRPSTGEPQVARVRAGLDRPARAATAQAPPDPLSHLRLVSSSRGWRRRRCCRGGGW